MKKKSRKKGRKQLESSDSSDSDLEDIGKPVFLNPIEHNLVLSITGICDCANYVHMFSIMQVTWSGCYFIRTSFCMFREFLTPHIMHWLPPLFYYLIIFIISSLIEHLYVCILHLICLNDFSVKKI